MRKVFQVADGTMKHRLTISLSSVPFTGLIC